MSAFDANGRLRHLGALKLLGDAQTPLAERPIKVADRLAAALLGGRMDESPQPTRLRMVELPVHTPGREASVATMTALLQRPSHLPIVLAGPDADTLIATAFGRPLVAAHVRDIADRDVMAEAALIVALENRPLIFEGLEDIEPAERGGLLRAIEQRRERTILVAPHRTAALALGERTVLLVEAGPPSFAERRQAWSDLTGVPETADVAAKFRLSMTQIVEAAEVARLSAAARGDTVARPHRPRRRRPPGLLLQARRARRAAPAGLPVERPRGPGQAGRAAAVHQRLPAPPRPGARATGATRRPSRAPRA